MEKKKIIKSIFAILLILLLLSARVFAAEAEDKASVPEAYSSLAGELEGEMDDFLPDGISSSDIDVVGEAVSKMTSAEYVFSFLKYTVGVGLDDAVSLLVSLCGILVLSAVFSAFKGSFGTGGMSKAVSICSSAALIGCVISVQAEHFFAIGDFFDRISLIMNGMIPTIGVIYAMGGNVTTASVSSSTLYIFLSFCEEICRTSVIGVGAICTAFSLCSSLSGGMRFGGLSSVVKKSYTFILGLIMTVLLAVLSMQTLLTSSADSVSARAAKLVASNVIPIVGSSVGDTLRTLASSVGYIKNVCGIGGIAFILILVLPIIVRLLLIRWVFVLAVAIAELIGCDSESKLLSELGSVYGVLIAVVSMCSVMFVLAITIFLRSSIAVG